MVKALGGIATLGIGSYVVSQPAKSAQLSIQELDIPNKETEVSKEVVAVPVDVSGSWRYNTSTSVSKVILRLEATVSDSFVQVDALDVSSTLGKSASGNFTLSGDLLETLPALTSEDVNPDNVGATTGVDIQFRVTMTVRSNGRVLVSKTATDTARLEVTKKVASVDIGLDTSGSLNVVTATGSQPHRGLGV